MNKSRLCAVIVSQLEVAVSSASAAADQARATATDKQNVAENKYDTLGLEAAYLAHGQSERVVQLAKSLDDFKELFRALSPGLSSGLSSGLSPELSEAREESVQPHDQVKVGSLVCLEDDAGSERTVFVGPSAGGHMVTFEGVNVTVITASSPLGQSLMTLAIGDDVVTDIAGKKTDYLISGLW